MHKRMCHCGKPLHYTDSELQKQMERLCSARGEFINVQVGEKTWSVQRHYIALHGIKGADLEMLGFERVR